MNDVVGCGKNIWHDYKSYHAVGGKYYRQNGSQLKWQIHSKNSTRIGYEDVQYYDGMMECNNTKCALQEMFAKDGV